MKAIIRQKYGSPEVLELTEIDKPQPKPDEVLIKVHASTINRTDGAVLTGSPFIFRFFIGLFSPRLKTTGTDFAGQVVEVGNEVKDFVLGDRVWGFNDEGLQSHAEYMVIKENKNIVKIPEGIDYVTAAASAEGPHYAYNFITKTKLEEGTKILLNGSTGGIGSAGLQMLKYFNCYVTAVANTKNIELIKSLGADKVYNYETEDFTKDAEKYNYVWDAVGKSNFGLCKPLLKEKGKYISSELGPGGENIYLPLLTLFSSKKVIFPVPTNIRRSLLFMNRLLLEGRFKPVIDKTYKMEEVAEAFEYVMSGNKTGNVVLSIP